MEVTFDYKLDGATYRVLIVKKNNHFIIEYTTNPDIYVTTYLLV